MQKQTDTTEVPMPPDPIYFVQKPQINVNIEVIKCEIYSQHLRFFYIKL